MSPHKITIPMTLILIAATASGDESDPMAHDVVLPETDGLSSFIETVDLAVPQPGKRPQDNHPCAKSIMEFKDALKAAGIKDTKKDWDAHKVHVQLVEMAGMPETAKNLPQADALFRCLQRLKHRPHTPSAAVPEVVAKKTQHHEHKNADHGGAAHEAKKVLKKVEDHAHQHREAKKVTQEASVKEAVAAARVRVKGARLKAKEVHHEAHKLEHMAKTDAHKAGHQHHEVKHRVKKIEKEVKAEGKHEVKKIEEKTGTNGQAHLEAWKATMEALKAKMDMKAAKRMATHKTGHTHDDEDDDLLQLGYKNPSGAVAAIKAAAASAAKAKADAEAKAKSAREHEHDDEDDDLLQLGYKNPSGAVAAIKAAAASAAKAKADAEAKAKSAREHEHDDEDDDLLQLGYKSPYKDPATKKAAVAAAGAAVAAAKEGAHQAHEEEEGDDDDLLQLGYGKMDPATKKVAVGAAGGAVAASKEGEEQKIWREAIALAIRLLKHGRKNAAKKVMAITNELVKQARLQDHKAGHPHHQGKNEPSMHEAKGANQAEAGHQHHEGAKEAIKAAKKAITAMKVAGKMAKAKAEGGHEAKKAVKEVEHGAAHHHEGTKEAIHEVKKIEHEAKAAGEHEANKLLKHGHPEAAKQVLSKAKAEGAHEVKKVLKKAEHGHHEDTFEAKKREAIGVMRKGNLMAGDLFKRGHQEAAIKVSANARALGRKMMAKAKAEHEAKKAVKEVEHGAAHHHHHHEGTKEAIHEVKKIEHEAKAAGEHEANKLLKHGHPEAAKQVLSKAKAEGAHEVKKVLKKAEHGHHEDTFEAKKREAIGVMRKGNLMAGDLFKRGHQEAAIKVSANARALGRKMMAKAKAEHEAKKAVKEVEHGAAHQHHEGTKEAIHEVKKIEHEAKAAGEHEANKLLKHGHPEAAKQVLSKAKGAHEVKQLIIKAVHDPQTAEVKAIVEKLAKGPNASELFQSLE
eukprot:TRINITY_DN578_c0_g1_i1.p1 TRINITY_DN578_c0_g1~~TRINITY_DN578_c0_g1_i1.p1  ORF type:complete len:964 (+),score=371.93 TRINITY_DN578_c0_g1_i1:205-3096(+)